MSDIISYISPSPRIIEHKELIDIDYSIDPESNEYKKFLEDFKDFFIEIEDRLIELTNKYINVCAFQIPELIDREYINFFSYYFYKLKYQGELIFDYRNNNKYNDKEDHKGYYTIRLIWEIKEEEIE